MKSAQPFALIIVAVLAAASLAGCTAAGIAAGAGATVGVAAVQERGLRDAAKDAGTAIAINERLLQRSLDLFGKISVSVVEGRVMLTGAVRSDADRDEAARIAWQAQNAREVLNEIQVTPGGGILDTGRDAWVSAQLRGKMIGDRQISDVNYSIETVNNTVYVIGIAQDQAEIVRVVDYARAISGVRRVVSHVVTKDDPRRRGG
jgi:osmotically-inducible protein OsmY